MAPGFADLRSYDRKFLRGDVVGGLTVYYLVPQVMAYATLGWPAGGERTVVRARATGGLRFFGTSRLLSAGPESTTALMTATAAAPLAAGDPVAYASMAAVLAIMVGVVCLFAGIIRLGFLADLLSRPVLVGYMTGLAVIMICSQLGKLTGAPVEGNGIVDQIASLISVRHQLHVPTLPAPRPCWPPCWLPG